MSNSGYYQQSVELGKKFQLENKNWDGRDTFGYHQQIKDVVARYNCKTLLDYGCGKGHQWSRLYQLTHFEDRPNPEMMFKDYLNIDSYTLYDPCVEEFSKEPTGKFDIVICNQVLPSIPDQDLGWVKEKLQSFSKKVCFIGMHTQTRPPKAKKQIYNKEYFSIQRTEEWYYQQFASWQGSDLYWWFRDRSYYPEWMNNVSNRP